MHFEPHFDKKTANIFRVLKAGQFENSNDMTTATMPLIFNEEETVEPGHHINDDGNPLSFSNLSFNEPPSPINHSNEHKLEEDK